MIAVAIAWVIANPWTAAFIIASTTYSIMQAKKMRKAMRDAAEVRKGYEIVTSGSIQAIPIVYGRALIGGTRVWHNTKSTHELPEFFTSNADKIFDVGAKAVPARTEIYYDTEENSVPIEYAATLQGSLNKTIAGSKNEFLYFQQVLCHGPINKVADFVIDESRYSNDPDLAKAGNIGGFRTEIHYDGSERNDLISYNFGDRFDAKFPGIAYASTVIRLNRDDPQFSGQVPMVQYYIEGRKVRTVSSGVLSSTRIYTNNPAWCLLDYLLEDTSRLFQGALLFDPGKGLTVDQIDLNSFEAAATICNTTVATNKLTYGKIWHPTDGTGEVLTRNIPLYECNIVVDPEKPIRENIENILSCMGDARLVWSSGKYKLSLQYPASNSAIQVATTVTDDDLVQGAKFELVWPTSSERLNHAIVRFHNESENFKEDTASWPPKQTQSYYKGIGGIRYPVSEDATGGLYDSYGVWQGSDNTPDTFNWKFIPKNSGNYTFQIQADDSATVLITTAQQAVVFTGGFSGAGTTHTRTIALNNSTIYNIYITATNNGGPGAIAARFINGSIIEWNTREPSYSDFELVSVSDAVYQQMLTEDSGVKLESTIFLDGCTDYYHALAKAEELVRTSRTAIAVSFEYIIKDKFVEPGDFIKIESDSLSIGDEDFYIRVSEVKLSETGTCEVKGSKFDYTQLAWNVSDDEYVTPPNVFGSTIPAPTTLAYVPIQEIGNGTSIGELNWTAVTFDSFSGYAVYYTTYDDLDSQGLPILRELGRTVEPSFKLPNLDLSSAIFYVRTFSKSNRYSAFTSTGTTAVIIPKVFPRSVEINSTAAFFIQLANSTNFQTNTITLTTIIKNYQNPQYRWFVNSVLISGATTSSLVVNAFETGLSKQYRVEVYESSNEQTQAEDYFTIYSIKEGSSAYTILLTNESKQLIANSEGIISPSELPYQIVVTVLRGIIDVTSQCTIYVGNLNNLSATISNNTITVTALQALTGNGIISVGIDGLALSKVFYANKIVPGASAELLRLVADRYGFPFLTADSTSSLYPEVNFSVLLENIDGNPIVIAYAYNYSNSLIGQFNIIPDQNNQFVITETQFNQYNSTQTAYLKVVATLEDLSDTIVIYRVNDGTSSFIFNIENQTHLVPATYDGQIIDLDEAVTKLRVYKGFEEITNLVTFSITASGGTAEITGQGTNNVILSALTMTQDVATFNVTATIEKPGSFETNEFISVSQLFTVIKARAGTPGTKSLIIYAYKRSTTVPTALPGAAVYNFSTNAFQSSLANGWTIEIPAYIDQNYTLYATAVTAVDEDNDNLGSVAADDWSSAVVYNGNSFSSASVFLYKRTETDTALSDPVTSNNLPSIYTFRTKELTNIPSGWFVEIPPKNANDRYLWVSVATVASSTETDSINGATGNSEWSTPVILAEKGEDATAFVGELTNDSHTLAASSSGEITSYTDASGTFRLYQDGVLLTTGVTFAYVSSSGFSTAPTASINSSTGVYAITGVGSGGIINSSSNVATVTYSATVNSVVVSVLTFTITKAKAGVDGVNPILYKLEASIGVIRMPSSLNSYSPATLTFNAFNKTGDDPWQAASVTIAIEASVAGSSWTQLSIADNVTTATYTLGNAGYSYRFFRGLLKVNGVTLDTETVPVVSDGTDGTDGTDGSTAYSIRVVSSGQVFVRSKVGVISPDYITLNAITQNTFSTINWTGATLRSGTSPSSSVVTTGSTVYLHKGDFSTDSVTITATPNFPSNINDKVTISLVEEGFDAVTVSNSNQTHQINAYAGGQPTTMAGSGTTIGVYIGATALSYSTTVGVLGTFTITSIQKSFMTANNPTSGTIADHISMDDGATAGSIVYNISYTTSNGLTGTISTTQTFTKNILAGSVSITGTAVTFAYNVDNSSPTPSSSVITASATNILNPYYVFKKGITTLQEGSTATFNYTPAASYLNMPESITVQVFKDSLKVTQLASDTIALNATRVGATGTGTTGSPGSPGAATYYINRGSSSSSSVPTDSEVSSVIGRYPVVGDLATISYNSGVNAISYRCTVSYPSSTWSVQTSFLSGDLFVSGSITGDKINTNTLIAKTMATDVGSVKKITINESNSNEMYFYADRGDGVIERLASIGIFTESSDQYILYIGSAASRKIGAYFKSGFEHGAISTTYKDSSSPDSTVANGLHGQGFGAYTGGVFGYASGGTNNTGVYGLSNGSSGQNQFSRGVWGVSVNGVGVFGEGATYDFYAGGSGSNYGPFTGTHDGLIDVNDTVEIGDIVIDAEVLYKYSLSNCLFRNTRSSNVNQKGVIGVVSAIKPLTLESLPAALIATFDRETQETIPVQNASEIINNRLRLMINAIGEGQINVCGENGNIEVGDLIVTSSMPGKGMKQSDDIVRNYTVAKARESVIFESLTDVKQIACIYLCG